MTIDEDERDEKCADPGGPRGEWSPTGDGNQNADCEGEEHNQGGEKGTRTVKGT